MAKPVIGIISVVTHYKMVKDHQYSQAAYWLMSKLQRKDGDLDKHRAFAKGSAIYDRMEAAGVLHWFEAVETQYHTITFDALVAYYKEVGRDKVAHMMREGYWKILTDGGAEHPSSSNIVYALDQIRRGHRDLSQLMRHS